MMNGYYPDEAKKPISMMTADLTDRGSYRFYEDMFGKGGNGGLGGNGGHTPFSDRPEEAGEPGEANGNNGGRWTSGGGGQGLGAEGESPITVVPEKDMVVVYCASQRTK
ncbi:MAG: hypothetical protein AB1611_04595 [bacterium]